MSQVARPDGDTRSIRRDPRHMRASIALVQDYLADLRERASVSAQQSSVAGVRVPLSS